MIDFERVLGNFQHSSVSGEWEGIDDVVYGKSTASGEEHYMWFDESGNFGYERYLANGSGVTYEGGPTDVDEYLDDAVVVASWYWQEREHINEISLDEDGTFRLHARGRIDREVNWQMSHLLRYQEGYRRVQVRDWYDAQGELSGFSEQLYDDLDGDPVWRREWQVEFEELERVERDKEVMLGIELGSLEVEGRQPGLLTPGDMVRLSHGGQLFGSYELLGMPVLLHHDIRMIQPKGVEVFGQKLGSAPRLPQRAFRLVE